MHYSKQAGALAFHDTCRQTHIVLAEDISSHGHKRYHVVRRADIGGYHGPYNELIRKDSKCLFRPGFDNARRYIGARIDSRGMYRDI